MEADIYWTICYDVVNCDGGVHVQQQQLVRQIGFPSAATAADYVNICSSYMAGGSFCCMLLTLLPAS
jgi:hypothetical protein